MTEISLENLRAAVIAAKKSGKIFTVTTRKRSDGSPRRFICRGGVKPPESTKSRREFTPANDNLITIAELVRNEAGRFTDKQFRCVALEGLISARIAGVSYVVK